MKKLTVSQNVYLYTFIDSTVSMSLILIVPLYLVSLGITLSGIGFILALTPIAFAFLRLFLAEIADKRGPLEIVKLGAVLRGASALFYLLPMNFFLAGIANIFSGFAGSPIWTVNRKILYENDRETSGGKKAAILKNVREGADAFAKLFSASIAQFFGFFASFLAIFLFSLLLVIPVRGIFSILKKPKKRKNVSLHPWEILSTLDLRKYGSFFSRTSLAGVICLASDGMIFSFAAIIFLNKVVGLSYIETGMCLALFSVVSFLSLFIFLRQKIIEHVSVPGTVIYAVFLVLAFGILYFMRTLTGALVFAVLLGISDGVRALYVEEVVAKAVSVDPYARKNPAKAIAVLGFWSQGGKSVAVLLAGIVAEFLGFGAVFLLIIATHLAYVFINRALLTEKVAAQGSTQKA